MAQVRVSHLIIGLILLVLIGGPLLICVGVVVLGYTIPGLDLGFIKTPELTKKAVNQAIDEGVDTAAGFTPAKTPTEAMDQFRKAIQERNYRAAKKYVTKSYGDMLERAHPAARELGLDIDKINAFAKEKALETDKVKYFLYKLDPFPKNFISDKAPEQKGDKAFGKYKWEPLGGKLQMKDILTDQKDFEADMYQNVLAPPLIFQNVIELVKEGDEWKLNVPTNPGWETVVGFFIDREKAHHNGLETFTEEMTRLRVDNARQFEAELFLKLRNAKK